MYNALVLNEDKAKEIKPCQFCGSKAKIQKHPSREEYIVICNNKSCNASGGEISSSEKEAIKKWNNKKDEKLVPVTWWCMYCNKWHISLREKKDKTKSYSISFLDKEKLIKCPFCKEKIDMTPTIDGRFFIKHDCSKGIMILTKLFNKNELVKVWNE